MYAACAPIAYMLETNAYKKVPCAYTKRMRLAPPLLRCRPWVIPTYNVRQTAPFTRVSHNVEKRVCVCVCVWCIGDLITPRGELGLIAQLRFSGGLPSPPTAQSPRPTAPTGLLQPACAGNRAFYSNTFIPWAPTYMQLQLLLPTATSSSIPRCM